MSRLRQPAHWVQPVTGVTYVTRGCTCENEKNRILVVFQKRRFKIPIARSHISHSCHTLHTRTPQNSQAKPGFSGFCPFVTPLHPAPRLAGCDSVTGSGAPAGCDPLGASDPLGADTRWVQATRWVFGHPGQPGQPGQRQPSRGEGGPAAGRSRWRRDHEHFYFFSTTHKNMFPMNSPVLAKMPTTL